VAVDEGVDLEAIRDGQRTNKAMNEAAPLVPLELGRIPRGVEVKDALARSLPGAHIGEIFISPGVQVPRPQPAPEFPVGVVNRVPGAPESGLPEIVRVLPTGLEEGTRIPGAASPEEDGRNDQTQDPGKTLEMHATSPKGGSTAPGKY
jgi:hypothetical protein